MICPHCAHEFEVTQAIADLVICPLCLRTSNSVTGLTATGADTLTLSPEQLAALKSQRRDARKARVTT